MIENYLKYIKQITKSGFSGDIENSSAQKFVAATDNSIYQELPELILYPKTAQDLKIIISKAKNFTLLI